MIEINGDNFSLVIDPEYNEVREFISDFAVQISFNFLKGVEKNTVILSGCWFSVNELKEFLMEIDKLRKGGGLGNICFKDISNKFSIKLYTNKNERKVKLDFLIQKEMADSYSFSLHYCTQEDIDLVNVFYRDFADLVNEIK